MIYYAMLRRNKNPKSLYVTYAENIIQVNENLGKVSRGGDTVEIWYGYLSQEGYFMSEQDEPVSSYTVDCNL